MLTRNSKRTHDNICGENQPNIVQCTNGSTENVAGNYYLIASIPNKLSMHESCFRWKSSSEKGSTNSQNIEWSLF